MTSDDRLVTRAEAAAWWRVTTRTVDRWRQRGLLPAVVAGGVVRFRAADVRAAGRNCR